MRRLIYLGLIVLIGFGLRVHLLGNQELRGDEGFTWNYIQKPPLEIVATIVREGDPQPPLHYWLQWGWLQFTGDSEFSMRVWSTFLGLLLVPLIYQVGRQLWRAEVGWLAAGLTAIHPQQIWLAQDVRNMYQLALVFLLVATLMLPHLQSWNKSKRISAWIVYCLCGVLAMYSHYYALFFLMAHGFYIGLRPGNTASRLSTLGQWGLAGLIVAALVAPWAVVILPVYAGGQLADPGHLAFLPYALQSFGDLLAGPAQTDSLKLACTMAFAILVAVVLAAALYRNLPPARTPILPFLAAGILIPLVGTYAVIATRSTFNTFYFTFAFPFVYLLIAGATYFLHRQFAPFGWGLGAALLLILSLGLYNHYYNPSYTKTRGFRPIASYLAAHTQPDDIYLANTPDPAQVYYIHNLNLIYHMEPSRLGLPPDLINRELEPLTAQRIWFVPANSAEDPHQYVAQRLNEVAILAEDRLLYRTTLQLFLPTKAAKPLSAVFAGGIRLVGYYYAPNRLTLVWVAEAAPSADYTIFVHADATTDAFTLAGKDSPPYLPTSQWKPGQLIVDVHQFDVPADQSVTLVAGLYLPATGVRLPLKTEAWGETNAAKVITLTP